MAQNLLTDDQCNRLSNYNELLKTFINNIDKEIT